MALIKRTRAEDIEAVRSDEKIASLDELAAKLADEEDEREDEESPREQP